MEQHADPAPARSADGTGITDGGNGITNGENGIDAAKTALRRHAFAARRAMDADDRERYGRALAPFASDLLAMARGIGADRTSEDVPVVAAFVSMGTEPPMGALLGALLDAGARLLVPRLGAGRDLGWAWLGDLDDLRDMGERRPREPQAGTLPADAMRSVDLVVMPALGIDTDGNRLGRGGGWYDRMLALRAPGTPAVAVIYPWELMVGSALPHAPHDMPVDATLTDAGISPCGHHGGR